MKEAYLVDYVRSTLTRAHPRRPEVDGWADIRGDTLLAQVIDGLLARTGLDPVFLEDGRVTAAPALA